jgi:hypothetical protein
MKQFKLLAVIAITLLAAASCVEFQKAKKAASTHAGHHGLSRYLGIALKVLLKRSVCHRAANSLRHLARKASVKAARHTVHLAAQCAAKLGRKNKAKRLNRAHRRGGKAKGSRRKTVARKIRRSSRRTVRRTRKARKGKKARKARRAAGSVLANYLVRVVTSLLK